MNQSSKPQHYLLAGKRRTMESNKSLGRALAFIAGAINAGGFMVVHQYTSHMTGILSLAVDNIALEEWGAAIAMMVYIACFIAGAATTALLVIWARGHHLHSQYALPLTLEALILIIFGLLYSTYRSSHTQLDISYMIALLCYLMGLQNAVITKISNTTIRTTHITGMATDIGIEIGKILFARKKNRRYYIDPNKEKLLLHLSIVFMFMVGGIYGAYGFKYIGFLSVIPLAGYLLFVACAPIRRDITIKRNVRKRSEKMLLMV